MLEAVEVEDALKEDARWQLIERILASGPFQKSARLRELLRYMSESAIHALGPRPSVKPGITAP
jgi:hypothetical protein